MWPRGILLSPFVIGLAIDNAMDGEMINRKSNQSDTSTLIEDNRLGSNVFHAYAWGEMGRCLKRVLILVCLFHWVMLQQVRLFCFFLTFYREFIVLFGDFRKYWLQL